jgi:hypothetical protein
MTDIVNDTPGYTIGNRSWRPPSTWGKARQMVVKHVKDWLEQAITNGKSSIVTLVIVVAGQTYRIDTTTIGLYHWRRRLCSSAASSTALRAPS